MQIYGKYPVLITKYSLKKRYLFENRQKKCNFAIQEK